MKKIIIAIVVPIISLLTAELSYAQIVPEIIESIPNCECYEVGTAEASQPANTTLYYSDDDQATWTYSPVADGDGKDCSVTDIKITYDDISSSDSEDLAAEFTGTTTGTTVVTNGDGEVELSSTSVAETKTFGNAVGFDDRGYDLATDSSDNVFMTGGFGGTIDFDATTGIDNHTAGEVSDIFITKYNSDGSYGWTRSLVGGSMSNYNYGFGITADPSGNVFATGNFAGTVDFDGTAGTDNHTTNFNGDIFITKYGSDGSYGWTRSIGSTARDVGEDVATDSSGNVFVTGVFVGTVNFDDTGGTDNYTSSGSNGDLFLTKYNSDGSYGWTRVFGSVDINPDYSYGIEIDSLDNVFIAGGFRNTVDFDGTAGVDNHTSNGDVDIFITKYANDGSYIWTKTFGGTSTDWAQDVSVNSGGEVIVIGTFYSASVDFDASAGTDTQSSFGAGDVFMSKYAGDGSYGWTKVIGGVSNDIGYGSSTDSSDNIYLTGHFRGTADFDASAGTDNRTSSSGGAADDIFITKYNSDGSYGWTRNFGGAYHNYGYGVAADSSGDVYGTGFLKGTVNFDDTGGVDNRTAAGPAGNDDIFLVKYNSNGSYSSVLNYSSPGTYETSIASTAPLSTWGTLSITQTVPVNTTLLHEVFASDCTTSLISQTASSSIDMSGIDVSNTTLCLVSTFTTTNPLSTSVVDDWTAGYDISTTNTDTAIIYSTVANPNCPTDITLSDNTIDENQAIGTNVGTLTTTDIDIGDTHTYSFACSTPGADDASFQISGNFLQSNEIFDYETKTTYSICIRTDDGSSGTYDKNFTININDLAEGASVTSELSVDLTDIRNITTNSLDLRVEVERTTTITTALNNNILIKTAHAAETEETKKVKNEDLDFKVRVTNKDTGEEYTEKISEKTSENGKATLEIEDLSPGTTYSFKVKASEEDENDYSDYSNKKTATTLAEEPATSFISTPISETSEETATPSTSADLFEGPEEKAPAPASPGATPQKAITQEEDDDKEEKPIIKKGAIKEVIEENPVVTSTTVATGLVAGAAAAGAASTASIPFYPLAPGFLRRRFTEVLTLLPMIASSKKRFAIPTKRKEEETYWGVVFDSFTKHPISEVLVQLIDTEKRRVVDQTVTDENGRYGFLISEDKEYELTINKGDYKLDTKKTKDNLYGELYTKKQIFKKETPIQLNIALEAKGFNWERFAQKIINQYNSSLAKFVKYSLDVIHILGFSISIYAAMVYPSLINYTILAFYFIFLVYRVITRNKKQFGTVVSKQNKKPLPFTVIELYDTVTNQRVNFTVSDILGRYYLLANNGNYTMKIKSMSTIDGTSFEGQDEINVKNGILREDFVV